MNNWTFPDFRSKYVFYNNLAENPKYMAEYQKLKGEVNEYADIENTKRRLKQTAQKLYGMARSEARKECQLLKEEFGVNLNFSEQDIYTSDFGKQLQDAVNINLDFKDEYERALSRISSGQAKITVWQLFPNYFDRALVETIQKKIEDLREEFATFPLSKLKDYLFGEEALEEVLEKTIELMGVSKDFNGKDVESQGMLTFLNNLNQEKNKSIKNKFMKEIWNLYKLDELSSQITREIKSKKQLLQVVNGKKGKYVDARKIKEDTYQKGTLAEIAGATVASVIANGVQGKNLKITIAETGPTQQKSDITMTYHLNYEPISKIIEDYYEDRAERVAAFAKLGEKMRTLKNGFLIFQNVKSYTITNDFKGFSAGSAINLKSFEGVLAKVPGSSKNLISKIMNTLKGSMLYEQQDKIIQEIASQMAYFLFDDVNLIGSETKGGAHTIHLMQLDDVYITLSYMLFLLGKAFDEVATDSSSNSINKIFKVDLSKPKHSNFETLYPSEGQKAREFNWTGAELWKAQRQDAYQNIRIQAHFLKNFRQIIKEIQASRK